MNLTKSQFKWLTTNLSRTEQILYIYILNYLPSLVETRIRFDEANEMLGISNTSFYAAICRLKEVGLIEQFGNEVNRTFSVYLPPEESK